MHLSLFIIYSDFCYSLHYKKLLFVLQNQQIFVENLCIRCVLKYINLLCEVFSSLILREFFKNTVKYILWLLLHKVHGGFWLRMISQKFMTWHAGLAPQLYFKLWREKEQKIKTLPHVYLLFHFGIFCIINGAGKVIKMDHKSTILVINKCLYLYGAIFNVYWIPQSYLFVFIPCIPATSFNLLFIQPALLFTTAILLIFLFWRVTTKKIHIWTFSLTGQSQTHRHSGLPFPWGACRIA